MQQTLHNPETQESKAKAFPVTIATGVVLAAAILAGLWFLFEQPQGRNSTAILENSSLKMGPAEQEYAKKIEIGKIALSRAENFLHQEVTILNGEVYNAGTEPVVALSLTTEFLDDMNQVVLRETRRVLKTSDATLAPGERRDFEISFEHVPNAWNLQAPAVRVSYLQLPAAKQ
jgi:hypothetical protein